MVLFKVVILVNVLLVIGMISIFTSVQHYISNKCDLLFMRWMVMLMIIVCSTMIVSYYRILVGDALMTIRNIILMLTSLGVSIYLYIRYKDV